MRIKQPKIQLTSLQIKSLEKAQKLCAALNTIEEECGIHQVTIEIIDPFICPWIDLEQLNATPMEQLIQKMLIQFREPEHDRKD